MTTSQPLRQALRHPVRRSAFRLARAAATPVLARRSIAVLLAFAMVAALSTIGACTAGGESGSSSDAEPRPEAGPAGEAHGAADPLGAIQVDSALHDRLPVDLRTRGTLRIVTEASYPPLESFAADGHTVIGLDPDLAVAIGRVLGMEVAIRDSPFSSLIDLVDTGGADLVISAMTDTAERQAQLDFVDYFAAGTSIVVSRGNPGKIADLGDLCGRTVASEVDTTQAALLQDKQTSCAVPMTIVPTETNDDALVLLRTRRADAVLMDYPPAERLINATATRAFYEIASAAQYQPGLYGIGVAKSRPELRDAVAAALGKLIEIGVYDALLARWDVEHGAIESVRINAGG